MAIENLTFCWSGFVTNDIDKTFAFFPKVLGWGTQEVDMGGATMKMFTKNGAAIGHLRAPQMEGEPSWWNNYLRVEDLDAATASVAANGGSIVVPPTKVPPGQFSTVTTASGAYMTLFRESAEDDNGAPADAVTWVDLHSKNLAADLKFLKAAFGFETSEMTMPTGPYHILNPESATRAGAMQGQHAEAPSMWMAWANVDSVDDTLARVASSGGNVIASGWDVPGVGRMAIAQDPAGIVFGVMTPAQA